MKKKKKEKTAKKPSWFLNSHETLKGSFMLHLISGN